MKRLLILVAVVVGVALAYLKAYEATPTQANWSGKVRGDVNYGVGERFTANFDSITEVSLFTGTLGSGANYRLDVLDAESNDLVARQWGVAPIGDHKWLRFTSITPFGKFVRGRDYVVMFTRPNDSIQVYYRNDDPYKYGHIVVGGGGQLSPGPQPWNPADLCARIYGLARVGDEFAVHSNIAYHFGLSDSANWGDCIRREHDVGVRHDKVGFATGWGFVQPARDSWNWGWLDYLITRYANHGVRPYVSFTGTPRWAACAETYGKDPVDSVYRWFPDGGSLPCSLYVGVRSGNTVSAANYYAKYIYEFMRRYGPRGYSLDGSPAGTFWREHGNLPYLPVTNCESFDELAARAFGYDSGKPGWWKLDSAGGQRLVDEIYQDTIIAYGGNSVAARKSSFLSVFAREAQVVDSAMKMACYNPEDPNVKPVTGIYISHDGRYTDQEWFSGLAARHVDRFMDLATLEAHYGFFHGVPEDQINNGVRWMKGALKEYGLVVDGLWISSIGPSPDSTIPWPQDERALGLLETYALLQDVNCEPGPAVLGADWFVFSAQYMNHETERSWGIIDTAPGWESWAPAHAYEQLSELTERASFEGQLTALGSDNPVRETAWVHVFQYRDSLGKRFWVAWELPHWGYGARTLMAPARADTESGCGVDTGGSFNAWAGPAAPSGWFVKEFDTLPVIVFEGQNLSRPELVVDSLRMTPSLLGIGQPATAHVYFHNAGNDATPDWPAGHHYTYVVLRHNGDSVGQALYDSKLKPESTASVSIGVSSVPASWHGTGLFDATANYQQQYVELNGMDDNDGYSRNRVKWLAEVDSPYVVCGSHHNEPVALLGLRTYSKERDTTGQTPCDSARVVQWWYGLNDTVVHAADTTPWFCVNRATTFDTSIQFLSGQGKYRLFVQVEDSWSMSDLIPDSAHSYVFFDTTGPGGSIVINGGARFASSSSCSLRLAAHDSASGVASMRFTNGPKVNLVANGTFGGSSSSWSFAGSGSGYDSMLQMARLSAGSSQSSVRQFIPAESISAHSGDSCVLEANVMALMHGGNATGGVSVWYWKTRQDTSLHDTAWTLIDSAGYAGDLLSLTGRYNLSKHFLLTTPSAESGWTWRGGIVRVEAHGVDTAVGHVWTDDIALDVFHPQSGDAWFAGYDTLSQWDIGSGAGRHIVTALYRDSSGNENSATYADTIMLDATAPVVHISLPGPGQMISGLLDVTGWAYDPVVASGDTWFKVRRLQYRSIDSTNWRPVLPDSMSHVPAYPDSTSSLGPAVHLGYWSTTSVVNGMYQLRLSATDSAGQTSSCTTLVSVLNGGFGGGFCMGPDGGGTGIGEGTIYVGSATGTVLHLSSDLDSLDAFQVSDSGSQAYVTAVLEVSSDSLLILDARNRRVHKLHRNGQGRRRLVSGLSVPMDLRRDDDGNFWLVDKGLQRIAKFRSDGTLVFVRGGLGTDSLHFHSPEAIAVRGSLVYVADTKNDRISVWDTCGNYRATITGSFANPTAVTVTDEGAIYLTDGSDGKLKGITPLGGNILALVTPDSSKLRGLVPSEDGRWLFTLAPQPNRVYKVQIRGDESMPGGVQSVTNVILPKVLSLAQPFPNPARTRLNIAYALPRQTRVSIRLYDVAGKLVTTLANGEQKPGYYNLTWNRQDTKGRSCACGIYFCTLAAENQRFSRKVILTK